RKTEIVFEPVDLNALVQELAKMIQETFPKAVKLKLDPAKDLPLIRGDHNQLMQALLNLVVNARDAMTDGGTLTLKTLRTSGEEPPQRAPEASADSYVGVQVKDTGTGMDGPTRAHVFEPFFTTKGHSGGQGLGLAVVYGVVNSHHGVIELETEPGNG